MQKCPFCKTEIDDNAEVCRSCGAEYGMRCSNYGIRRKEECLSKIKFLFITFTIISILLLVLASYLGGQISYILIGFAVMFGFGVFITLVSYLFKKIFSSDSWWK
jgi:hypothetical protein